MYTYIYILYISILYIYSYWKPIIKVIGCHSHGYPQMPDVPSIFHILHPIHQIFWSQLPRDNVRDQFRRLCRLVAGRDDLENWCKIGGWNDETWKMGIVAGLLWKIVETSDVGLVFFNGVEHCRLLEVLPILPGTPLRPTATALPANEDPPPHQSLPWAWKSSKIIPKKIIQKLNQKNDEFQQNHPKSAPQNII